MNVDLSDYVKSMLQLSLQNKISPRDRQPSFHKYFLNSLNEFKTAMFTSKRYQINLLLAF